MISFCTSLGSILLLIERTTIDPLYSWFISKAYIDEGIHPLVGQIRQLASQSTGDEIATEDTTTKASMQIPQPEEPRVTTDLELLINLHQQIDGNHECTKRQLAAIHANMTVMHNAFRKNHYYTHEINI